MGEQDIPKPHIFALSQRQRLEQISWFHLAHFQQDLAQRGARCALG
jgi:hypothetical protein